jgi:hypothetical protein
MEGVFDFSDKDRDYLSIQNSSICLTDSESSIICNNKSAMPPANKRLTKFGSPRDGLANNLIVETNSHEYDGVHDWREDQEPIAPKHDSFLSGQVKMKENLEFNFEKVRK